MSQHEFVASYIIKEDRKRLRPASIYNIELPTSDNVLSGTSLVEGLLGKDLSENGNRPAIPREVRMRNHIAAYLDTLTTQQLSCYENATIRDFASLRHWRVHCMNKEDTSYTFEYIKYQRKWVRPILIVSCNSREWDRKAKLRDHHRDMLICGKNLEKYASRDRQQIEGYDYVQYYIVRIADSLGQKCFYAIQGDGHLCVNQKLHQIVEFKALNKRRKSRIKKCHAYDQPFISTFVALHDMGKIEVVGLLKAATDETKKVLDKADQEFDQMVQHVEEKFVDGIKNLLFTSGKNFITWTANSVLGTQGN
ncbi:unnamed protein product, partial [Mesorhabditis spiculigera]